MNTLNEKFESIRVVPVIKLNREEDAAPLAQALAEGSLPVMEITFRTDAAEGAIAAVAKTCPDVLVGAGTVTTVEQAKRAKNVGAQFIVMPGLSHAVVEYCLAEKMPVYPGACTPTEIMQVIAYGLNVVKFFPAGQFGGLATMKALAAPFPGIRFMPTGGVNEANLQEYLAFPKILACGGSWMVKDDLIQAGDFTGVTALAAKAVALAKAAR